MNRAFWIRCAAIAAAMVTGLSARAFDLTVIMNVSDDGAAYYMSLPATEIESVLGTDPDLLFSNKGSVPIDDFRLNGSFELGDDVFGRIEGHVGGERASFETMSMMVHPTNDPAPFQTPWDAVTATAVCIVDYEEDQLTPEYLQLYYGSYAHRVDGTSGLELSFPQTGREAVDVTLHLYQEGTYIGREKTVLEDGGTLNISFEQSTGLSMLWWAAIALWLTIMATAFFVARSRGQRGETIATNG
ncbi:MAG: hypothetical protein AAF681_14945 [Pseudomonadota bacterium]